MIVFYLISHFYTGYEDFLSEIALSRIIKLIFSEINVVKILLSHDVLIIIMCQLKCTQKCLIQRYASLILLLQHET